jgi:alpha-tubulin suppressor-like RCC1 family protein
LGDGFYVLDDTNVDYNALAAAAEAATPKLSRSSSSGSMLPMFSLISGSGGPPVYLTNMVATLSNGNVTATFSIAGGTNGFAYDIYSTTNLADSPVYSTWTWLGQGYTSNSYTFTNQPLDNAFYILAIPRQTMVVAWGDDSDGQCDVPSGLTNAIDVAGGYNFSLALKADGTVVAWGDNTYGETNVPASLTNVTAIAAGGDFALALLQNGTVVAWGGDANGQTNVPAGLTNVTAIAAGDACSLALRSNGSVVAWGYNYYGQTNVPAMGPVSQIAAGVIQGVALLTNSTVTQWGNYNGSSFGWTVEPTGLSNIVSIAAGACHSLAVNSNGTVTAWGAGAIDTGYNNDGQSIVPAGLSNVVVVAGGYLYSVALQSPGTVVAWGDDAYGETDVPDRLTGVKAISAGGFHGLAVRSGSFAPLILEEPEDQYAIAGGTVTFSAEGEGVAGVTYQWQFNGMPISGATNATLTLTNVSATTQGRYQVIITDSAGSVTSDAATFSLILPPQIISTALAPGTNWIAEFQSTPQFESETNIPLSVTAATYAGQSEFPLSYHWSFNGTNITGATSATYSLALYSYWSAAAPLEGTYTLTVTNAAGSTNLTWNIRVLIPGMVAAWGADPNGECDRPVTLTNVIALAAGEFHSVAVMDGGSVVQWGYNWGSVPTNLTNAMAVAAGYSHTLALRSNGTITAWGNNSYGQTNVPVNATNAIAVAAGGKQSLALLKNGTVVQWGQTNAPIPARLTNVTAIAAGTNFCLALLSNATVAAWGSNTYGQTNVPANLTNVVAVAVGGTHALALLQNGTIVSWGDNLYGETNVPGNLTNAMAIAAGDAHSVALLNNGTVVAWGDNTFGQTNVPSTLVNIKLIAAGGDHTLASMFSWTVQYPVNVTKDLLLIYNTNSLDSSNVCAYYLAKRPMVSSANVLGIGCPGIFVTNGGGSYYSYITNTTVYETVTYNGFTNGIVAPLQTWLNNNPTKRPQYVILFLDVPSRVDDSATTGANYPFDYGGDEYPSVSYQLATNFPGWNPFITHINMNGTNDCIAYINKLVYLGTNYSLGKLIISASAGGYGNTNYYFDDTESGYTGDTPGLSASNGVVLAGASPASVAYTNVTDYGLASHITNGVNIAGYLSWGSHSTLGASYAISNSVQWHGNDRSWIIETVESYNGHRYETDQGNFTEWFSQNAFGGTYYSNTPIGAVSQTDEPGCWCTVNNETIYFGEWAAGKIFARCAWDSIITPHFQAVGGPLVTK